MKTIIFDIDGTLTNMWPIEKAVLLRLLGRRSENTIDRIRNYGIKDTYKIFCKISSKKISEIEYRKAYEKKLQSLLLRNDLPETERYPTVDWILKNKSAYHFVYATGGREGETNYVLNSFGLAKYFDLKKDRKSVV